MESYEISDLYKIFSRDSGGSQGKYFKDNIWYKLDTVGEESRAENIISNLLEKSNVKSFVRYEICYVNGKRACSARNFLSENEIFISLHKLYMAVFHKTLADEVFRYNTAKERFDFLITVFNEITALDLTEYLSSIIALDMLCLNPDRHFKNIGVIYNGADYRQAPIFDNGQALGANWSICPPDLSVSECIEKISSCTIAGSFEVQFSAIKNVLSIDYDSLMKPLLNCGTKSRVTDILIYRLERYRSIFCNS